MSLIKELKEIYINYGFKFAKHYVEDNVLVFTITTGYYDNADIIELDSKSNTENAFKDYSALGFACKVRSIRDATLAENQLFKGFFSVDSLKQKLLNDYEKFTTSIIKPFSDDAVYEYINAPYVINGNHFKNVSGVRCRTYVPHFVNCCLNQIIASSS